MERLLQLHGFLLRIYEQICSPKETKLLEALEDILIKIVMDIEDTLIKKVKAHGQEVRMTNIQNRMKPETDTMDSQ